MVCALGRTWRLTVLAVSGIISTLIARGIASRVREKTKLPPFGYFLLVPQAQKRFLAFEALVVSFFAQNVGGGQSGRNSFHW